MTRSAEWRLLTATQIKTIQDHQQTFPVKIGSIAKELGLTVKTATLPAGVSGEIRCVDGAFTIRVNRHDVKERQRFTLAHEIAHFLLHRDKIGDGIVDDILYRSKLSDLLEVQANKLAADIIMPWHLMQNCLNSHSDLKNEQIYEKIAEEAQVFNNCH